MTTLSLVARRAAFSLLIFVLLGAGTLAAARYLITRPVTCAPRCTGINLAERSLQNEQLRNTSFIDGNLQRADLSNADLREADLSGANLSGANLRNADLRDAYLLGANLSDANLGGANLSGANLSGANLSGADLTAQDLTAASLDGADFSHAQLSDSTFTGADLAGSSFTSANLTGANLTKANLIGATMSGADLSSALLVAAQLTGAWLNQTNLTGADLTSADLTGASLVGSRLTSANLAGSSLRGALLVGANLDGANLRAADLTDIRIAPELLTLRDLQLDPMLSELNELQLDALRHPASLGGVQSDGATRWSGADLPAGSLPAGASAQGGQAVAAAAANGEPAVQAAGSLNPRRVRVNFYIDAIRVADSGKGLYAVDFTLDFHWFDPDFVGVDISQVDAEQLWHPLPELTNARDLRLTGESYQNSVEPGTNVRLTMKMKGLLADPFDLHAFPFDQQTLSLKIESGEYNSDFLLFTYIYGDTGAPLTTQGITQAVPRGRYLAPGAEPLDWQVKAIAVTELLHPLPYDKSTWSQFRIDIQMARLAGIYFWKILLLLILIVSLIWGVFWGNGRDLGMRLWMLSVLLLVTVAAHLLMLRSVPYTGALTTLDLYVMFCYALLAMSAAAVIVVRLLYGADQQSRWGEQLNRGLMVAYPVLLILLSGALYWYGRM